MYIKTIIRVLCSVLLLLSLSSRSYANCLLTSDCFALTYTVEHLSGDNVRLTYKVTRYGTRCSNLSHIVFELPSGVQVKSYGKGNTIPKDVYTVEYTGAGNPFYGIKFETSTQESLSHAFHYVISEAQFALIKDFRVKAKYGTKEHIFTLGREGCSESTFPVTLQEFKCVAQRGYMEVYWVTASESDVDRYMVERSADGVSFTPVGTVRSFGDSSTPVRYRHLDYTAPAGVGYYRLKTVDKDGTFSYSATIAYEIIGGDALVRVNGTELRFALHGGETAKGVTVHHLNGGVVVSMALPDAVPLLQGGAYVLTFVTDRNRYSRKIYIR
jgi:hypothetical protein